MIKTHTLLTFFITITAFSQSVISEFPIDIKHKVQTNKKTNEKLISLSTSQYLDQFGSKIYTLNEDENILLIQTFDKISIYLLDKKFNSSKVGIIEKQSQNNFPFHVIKEQDKIILYFKESKERLFSKSTKITQIEYNISTKKHKTSSVKFKPKNERILACFFLNKEFIILTNTSSSNILNIYKYSETSIDKIEEHNLNELEYKTSLDKFDVYASEFLKNSGASIPVINKDSNEPFDKTSLKVKIYKNQNHLFTLTIDDNKSPNKGTHIYQFDLDNISKKQYKYLEYEKSSKKLDYNSLISNNKLLQLGINSNEMKLSIINLISYNRKTYDFTENDSLFKDNNTHYAMTNIFTGKQKESNEKSIDNFLKHTSKGSTALSSIILNKQHHLLIGSKRAITRSSAVGGMAMSFSYSVTSYFDNYTYILLNRNGEIIPSLDLKKSKIGHIQYFSEKNTNLKLSCYFNIQDKYYTGYYDAINMLYKIGELCN